MTNQTKQLVVGGVAIIVIAVSVLWIYKSQFAKAPYEPAIETQRVVGEMLARETIGLVGTQAQIVVVTLQHGQSPELETHYKAFKDELKKSSSIKIVRTDTVSPEKAGKYGPGIGMSGHRYVKAVTQNPNAQAIVSLVGVPKPNDEALKELKGKPLPVFIAFSRDPKHLRELLDAKWVQAAIVPRFETKPTVVGKPKTAAEWFEKNFEIVRAAGTGG